VSLNRLARGFVRFGPLVLMDDGGKCPSCRENSLLMDVNEFGWHGTICRSYGKERRDKETRT